MTARANAALRRIDRVIAVEVGEGQVIRVVIARRSRPIAPAAADTVETAIAGAAIT